MDAANDNRPPEFDARVIAYLPGLKKLARRYTRNLEERDDLVTDTIALCLRKWKTFRPDGGLWSWMSWEMRGIASNMRSRKQINIVDDATGYIMGNAAIAPRQETYADLSQTLAKATSKYQQIAVRKAMGATLRELGDEFGISRQRVEQLVKRGQAEFRGEAA